MFFKDQKKKSFTLYNGFCDDQNPQNMEKYNFHNEQKTFLKYQQYLHTEIHPFYQ